MNSINFKTKKSLGQHFLVDKSVIDAIIVAAGDLSEKLVIEIGPGNLALTKELVKKAKKVISIEIDERLIDNLSNLAKENQNFHYIIGDALTINPNIFTNEKKVLIANLPYNIGTQIYLNYLLLGDQFDFFILMFQLEVAKRIIAYPKQANYGRLSIISDLLAKREFLFEVTKHSFSPPPKVTSAVIKITPFKLPRIQTNISTLENLTKLAFQTRRKILKNSIKSLNIDFDHIHINPQKRAEELSTEDFCKIANYLDNKTIILEK